MTDAEIIFLLEHLDKCLSDTWTLTRPYSESATHHQVLRAIKALENRQPTTIGELEKQGRI